jgi:hypothetical protein
MVWSGLHAHQLRLLARLWEIIHLPERQSCLSRCCRSVRGRLCCLRRGTKLGCLHYWQGHCRSRGRRGPGRHCTSSPFPLQCCSSTICSQYAVLSWFSLSMPSRLRSDPNTRAYSARFMVSRPLSAHLLAAPSLRTSPGDGAFTSTFHLELWFSCSSSSYSKSPKPHPRMFRGGNINWRSSIWKA